MPQSPVLFHLPLFSQYMKQSGNSLRENGGTIPGVGGTLLLSSCKAILCKRGEGRGGEGRGGEGRGGEGRGGEGRGGEGREEGQ